MTVGDFAIACHRCGRVTSVVAMSKLNDDTVCVECSLLERETLREWESFEELERGRSRELELVLEVPLELETETRQGGRRWL